MTKVIYRKIYKKKIMWKYTKKKNITNTSRKEPQKKTIYFIGVKKNI